jgi:uncharacterized protein (DUF488 family)
LSPAGGEAEGQNSSARIWTIGHSTRPRKSRSLYFRHALVADVRRFPSSRKNRQFNQSEFSHELAAAGIDYVHISELGGRRPAKPDSLNTVWRNASLRGYAEYIETPDFGAGIERLLDASSQRRAVIMCAEAVWWRCHRGLISDRLKSLRIEVSHIQTASDSKPHPFAPAARIVDGKLSYRG